MPEDRLTKALQTQGTWSSKSLSSLPTYSFRDAISPKIPTNGTPELSIIEAIKDFDENSIKIDGRMLTNPR